MRASVIIVVLLSVLLSVAPAGAQDAEALRKELEQLKRQQEQYQRAIEALSQRLQRLEQQPPAPAPVATPTPTAPTPLVQAPSTQPAPLSPAELLRPRQPFSLYQQRGSGQLLVDIGLAGDFVANFTQRSVDRADAGTFRGRENRFFPREVELGIWGQVDPFARAEVRIEAGEEAPGAETSVALAEANLTLLTLPLNTQLKMGQMRNRFGYANQIHEHDLPWVDRPNALRNFLGEEGFVEKGFEATWVPDLPFYLEALVGAFNGDNEAAFGYGKLSQPLVTGRLRTFVELGDAHGLLLGVSGAHGQTPDRLRSTLAAADLKYKLRPDGWLHPLLTVGGEAIYSLRQVERDGLDFNGDGVPDFTEKKTLGRWGWYAYGEVQPWRRWALGARYDWSQFPVAAGQEWAIQPYVTFWPSEFLRFRLAYKHTDRSHRDLFTDNGGSGRLADEILFQASFILGAHPAHPF
ncbi:MAG TPA: hypothetical protein VGR82_20195 [Methylomirabilota bacterium]|jgi:hypothetical protein|nr:hypothetical protein [Methylomirabilota bacterium]